jgi:hypothetical protein
MTAASVITPVELGPGTHIVGDPDGVAVLELLGFPAVLASHREASVAQAAAAQQPAVLVGLVDEVLRQELHDAGVEVFELVDVSSPVDVLGFAGGSLAKQWTEAEVGQGQRTWCTYLASARHVTPPTGTSVEDGTVIECVQLRRAAPAPWPKPLSDAVRIGLLAEVLDVVELQTEADPAAIVFDFMARVGNLVGRGPHVRISGDRHGSNLFVLIVGGTGQGRKGTSAAYPKQITRRVDAEWRDRSGLASGEGLIHATRDDADTGRTDKDGNPIIAPGVTDKRCMVTEAEFARTLKAAARKENTLASLLRLAWDGASLSAMTRQPYQATDPHISIVAHITSVELNSLLSSNDISGGTANRFLFVASKRQRILPHGGNVSDELLDRLGAQLAELVEFGRCNGHMLFTDSAYSEWSDHYGILLTDEQARGVAGELLARGAAHVRRMAMIFAILDRSRDVDSKHVNAAMECWRYSRDSVRNAFGVRTGNRLADLIHDELRLADAQRLDRSEIRRLLGHNVTSAQIEEALAVLQSATIAIGRKVKTGRPGKPREEWLLV